MARLRKFRSLTRKGTSLGLGALATYFLDKERGAKRREQALQHGRDLWGRYGARRFGGGSSPERSVPSGEHRHVPPAAPPAPSEPVRAVVGGRASISAPLRTVGLFSPRLVD